ncbi:MAG: YceI family protein [Bacteroidetes bacterium]|nr:YceI family protein [Bacteroidota bacterium]
MKKQAINFLTFLAISFAACTDAPSSENTDATTTEESAGMLPAETIDKSASGKYAVNTEASVIEWIGSKASGSQHNGTIKLQSGELDLYEGNITGGKMVIDMNSLSDSDLSGDDKAKLEGHLKTGDFFEVEKYPTGTFEFGSTMPATNEPSGAKNIVAGALTLKGISKPIRIPFNVSMENGKVMVETPEFVINRTDWDIKYNSGIIGTVKEKMIDDFVKLKLKLVAEAPAN